VESQAEKVMTRRRILQEDQSYTFRSYFDMPYEADEILAELGYALLRKRLDLPHSYPPNSVQNWTTSSNAVEIASQA
jgi:hypothetical protein